MSTQTQRSTWRSFALTLFLLVLLMPFAGSLPAQGRSASSGPSAPMVKWSTTISTTAGYPLAVGTDGTLYVGSTDGILYALDPTDGSQHWQHTTKVGDYFSFVTIGADGTIYIGTYDYHLYALNPADGSLRWIFAAGGYLVAPVFGADGTVYLGSTDGNLYALNPADGVLQWKFTLKSGGYSVPAIAVGPDGAVYGSMDNNLYALDPADGTLHWKSPTGWSTRSSLSIGADGTIYVTADKLYAFNPTDGTVKWQYTAEAATNKPAIGTDSTLYILSTDPLTTFTYLEALTPDGALKWRHCLGYINYFSSVCIDGDGTIYLAVEKGLCAFSPVDGSQKWYLPLGQRYFSAPIMGTDGTIYITLEDGSLNAIGQAPLPALTLSKSFECSNATHTGTVTYTLAYTNTGPGEVTGVTLTDPLPTDVSYVPDSAGDNASYDASTNTLAWSLGTLAAGAQGTVTFQTTVNPACTNPFISNTASITCSEAAAPVYSNPAVFNIRARSVFVWGNRPGSSIVTQPGSTVTVPIILAAVGDENALACSLSFDPTILSNPQVTLGADAVGALLLVNTAQAAQGALGLGIALPGGQTFAPQFLGIAQVSFTVNSNSPLKYVPITLTDTPVKREVDNVQAHPLDVTWTDGGVCIALPPVAVDDDYTVTENTKMIMKYGVLANDKKANTLLPLFAELVSSTTHGQLSLDKYNLGDFTYTPAPGYVGTDTFTYQVWDTCLLSNIATVHLTIKPSGYEADVASRPNGDKQVTVADWVQLGRFVVGIDTPSSPSEFQRADCAPFTSQGDGQLTVSDWVQAGRYVVGLDPLTPAGGPNAPTGSHVSRYQAASKTPVLRTVSLVPTIITRGKPGAVQVVLNAQGNESALGFTLNFDPKQVKFLGAKLVGAASNATLNVNTAQAARGHVGLALMLPLPQTLKAGKQALVELVFQPLAFGPASLTFGDQCVAREVAGSTATALPATFVNGTVMVRK